MEPQIKTVPSFSVVGMDYKGRTPWKIPQLWRTFGPRIEEIVNVVNPTVSYGLTSTYQEKKGFTYIACVQVSRIEQVPQGMTSFTVPEQLYVVFPCNLAKFRKIYYGVRKQWAPENGYELTLGPEFERYDDSYNPRNRNSEFEMYLPVRKAA
jgi:AraC family transcriptional regulator